MMLERLRGSSSRLSDGSERYGLRHRSNVETAHSIGLSVIIYATGVLDLAIVIEGSETTSDTCTSFS